MNKGKTILFCVIGLLVLITIGIFIYIFSLSDKDKIVKETNPLLSSKDSITYKDMLNITKEYSNSDEYQKGGVSDTLNIKSQLSSVYGINQNTYPNNTEKTINTYTEPTNYNNRQYDYLYENNISPASEAPKITNNTETIEHKRSWSNPEYKVGSNNSSSTNSSSKAGKIYQAMITGARKNIITQENNRVSIRVSEPFFIDGVEIPKNTILIAYANFGEKLTLSINSIRYNNTVIPVNIKVLDSQGQNALEVIGGTGSDIGNEASEIAKGELSTGNALTDKGINILSKKRAKMKARISSDLVFLKIEN